MQAVAFGYGDPETWGCCKPFQEVENPPLKLTRAERKKRSDITVNAMINQYQGLTVWSKSLSEVFHGKSMSDRRRFYFECRKRGVEVTSGKTTS